MSELEKRISKVVVMYPSDIATSRVPSTKKFVSEEDFKALARAASKLREQSEYLMSQLLAEDKLKKGMVLLDESALDAWEKK